MIERREITHAIESFLTANTTFEFASVAPLPPITYPYGLVYPIPSITYAPDMSHNDQIASGPWQITSVGQNYDQADALADLVRKFMLDQSYVMSVPDSTMTIADRDHDSGPTEPRYVSGQDICSIAERFRLTIDAP